MKKILLLFLVAIISGCGAGHKSVKKTDLDEKGLKGKVKSVEEIKHNAVVKFGEATKGEKMSSFLFKYDEKGNLIERNEYNSDNSLKIKTTYKYDEKGNRIGLNQYNSAGSLNSKETYKYDEKGNRIELNWYISDGSLYTCKYDEKGNWIEGNFYNSNGSLYRRGIAEYKYDNKGNWIELNSYKEKSGKAKEADEITERKIEYYE
jgi:hypothetical protein